LRIVAQICLFALGSFSFAQKETNQFIVGDSIKGVDIIHTLDNGKSSSYKGAQTEATEDFITAIKGALGVEASPAEEASSEAAA